MALNRRMPIALTAVAARRPWPDDEKSSSTALDFDVGGLDAPHGSLSSIQSPECPWSTVMVTRCAPMTPGARMTDQMVDGQRSTDQSATLRPAAAAPMRDRTREGGSCPLWQFGSRLIASDDITTVH